MTQEMVFALVGALVGVVGSLIYRFFKKDDSKQVPPQPSVSPEKILEMEKNFEKVLKVIEEGHAKELERLKAEKAATEATVTKEMETKATLIMDDDDAVNNHVVDIGKKVRNIN